MQHERTQMYKTEARQGLTVEAKWMDKYEREKESVFWGSRGWWRHLLCFFFPVYCIYLFERDTCTTMYPCYHDWSQRTIWRNRFSLLPRSSGIKLRPSTLAASAWTASYLRPSSGLLSWCLCASTRMLPFHPSSSSRIHCLAMPSVKPIHFAPYFSFYGFQYCDFQRCEVLCLTSGFVSNALPTSSFNPPHGFYTCPFNPLHVLYTCVSDTLWLAPLWETVPVTSCFLNFQCGFFAHHFGYSDGVWHSMSIYDKPPGKTFSLINV